MGDHCRGQGQASDALLKEIFTGSPAPLPPLPAEPDLPGDEFQRRFNG